jgi:dihydrofolate reductase
MNAIFAVDAIGGFGINGDMPWPHCSTDLKRFKSLTNGATVVMGSGTWKSNMPTPLPNRRNIVLSRTMPETEGCEVFGGITQLLMNIKQDEPVWVIGGAETLWKLRPQITTVYMTKFKLITRSTVNLAYETFLEDFTLTKTEDFGDHTLDIYQRK